MSRHAPQSTQAFLKVLKEEGELAEIDHPVSPDRVIPEIQRRIAGKPGPALLFRNVPGYRFMVATNLFGSQKRISLALGGQPSQHVKKIAQFMDSFPPDWSSVKKALPLAGRLLRSGRKRVKHAPVLQNRLESLKQIPALTSWPQDGGPFITLPLVYTQDPVSQKGNLGMYRVQIQNDHQAGMHIQIHRGGGNHYHRAEQLGLALPASVFVGGPPALTLAAVAPLPEDVPELAFASFLMNQRLALSPNPDFPELNLIAEADFCINGCIPPFKRAKEGPFGDHYGYYSLEHDYPFLEVSSIFFRSDAVYPATVVGRPPQEDHFIAIFLQEIFSPLFPLVMKGVKDVFAYEESGVHSLAAAIIKERYPKEAFTACMRILGEGQLSLTKVLLATEADLDPRNFRQILTHVLERCDFQKELHVFSNISQDTLDYTGPAVNQGSKAIFLGIGERKYTLNANLPPAPSFPDDINQALIYCPGVMVVKTPPYQDQPEQAKNLIGHPVFEGFRLIILHDDPPAAVSSDVSFIWNIFTRFEPAGDIWGAQEIIRNHIAFHAPLFLDCRLKPGYPEVLMADEETIRTVDQMWDKLNLT